MVIKSGNGRARIQTRGCVTSRAFHSGDSQGLWGELHMMSLECFEHPVFHLPTFNDHSGDVRRLPQEVWLI